MVEQAILRERALSQTDVSEAEIPPTAAAFHTARRRMEQCRENDYRCTA